MHIGEEIILFPIFFTLIGFVIWTIFSTIRRYKIANLQAGMQTKLLEKFGSGQELLAYVQSDAGKSFLESLTMEQRTPYRVEVFGHAATGKIVRVADGAYGTPSLVHAHLATRSLGRYRAIGVRGRLACKPR